MAHPRVDPDSPVPLYHQLYSSLLERITGGEFAVGDALPPERRLATDYGVSRITVVKALDLLEREGWIDRQHGRGTFVADPDAGAPLRGGEAERALAFLPGGQVHPYHYSVQMGIARVATRRRAHLFVIAHYHEGARPGRFDPAQLPSGIGGLILYPNVGTDPAPLRRLQRDGAALATVDRYLPDLDSDRVVFDEEVAAWELTRRLLERGHQRIAFVGHHEPEATSSRTRLAGYRRAMHEAGLAVDASLLVDDLYRDYLPGRPSATPARRRGLADALGATLRRSRATAVVTVNHDVAERINLDLLRLQDRRVRAAVGAGGPPAELPPHLEIAAFGHLHPVDYGPGTVAVALQSGEELGSRTAELILDRIDGRLHGPPRHLRLPVRIVGRDDDLTAPEGAADEG